MSVADLQLSQVSETPRAELFPLPLTTFESFMLADDSPDYPMLCDLEVQFQGCIDRTRFDAALAFAVSRNPLFTCLVQPGPKGTWLWVPTDRHPAVDWAPLGTDLGDDYGAFVDLTREVGLKIWVRQGDERSTVLLHFHHASSDALGGFAFIEDLLAGYANASSDTSSVTPRPIDLANLARRGTAGFTPRNFWQQIGDALVGLREGFRFFAQAPQPLATFAELPKDAHPLRPNFLTATLSEQEVVGLRQTASTAGGTVNDLLLRDLFLVLRRWNRSHGRSLRILMPQSLRDKIDRSMPSANMISFAFITRRGKDCDRPDKLLQTIRQETDTIRRGKLSLYFLAALATLQSTRLLSGLLRGPFCFATVVLTNMSDPARRFVTRFPRTPQGLTVGNLVFQAIAGSPPLRPRTRLAVGITYSANSLYITLKLDPRYYCPLDAQRLLGDYVMQLQQSASHNPA